MASKIESAQFKMAQNKLASQSFTMPAKNKTLSLTGRDPQNGYIYAEHSGFGKDNGVFYITHVDKNNKKVHLVEYKYNGDINAKSAWIYAQLIAGANLRAIMEGKILKTNH